MLFRSPGTAGTPDVNMKLVGGQTASASGAVTFPNATLASTTNISGGTITTATNVTTVNGLANGVITAALLIACGFLVPQTPTWLIMTVLFLHGLSRSMHFTALNTIAFVDIPKSMMSSATSFYSVVQQIGIGMGVAMGAVALRAAAFFRGERGAIPSLADFQVALWAVGALSLLALVD